MIRLIVILTLVGAMAGCGGSKLRAMPDAELAAKRDDCLRRNPTAPGAVTACENIRKECERRRADKIYAC